MHCCSCRKGLDPQLLLLTHSSLSAYLLLISLQQFALLRASVCVQEGSGLPAAAAADNTHSQQQQQQQQQ
jgi:hypothetical protein